MNTRTGFLSLLLLGLSPLSDAGDLGWLVGCWETPDRSSTEVWVEEQDGNLTGFSVVVDDNRVVFYEVLRIAQTDSEPASYTAHPVGQKATVFTLASASEQEVKFSNPLHDYPQEIAYKREGTVLYATISALNGKNPQSFNKRACE